MSKRKRRTGKGSVLLIVMLFVSSAAVRISTNAGFAIAESAHSAEPRHDQNNASGYATSGPSRSEMATLLDALRAREEAVAAREREAELRDKALSAADVEIRKRLAKLEALEKSLSETLAFADGAAEKDIARLVTVYESMKPKEAAALFETMEPSFAAGFLSRMRPESAAAVLAGLSAEKAYSISVILAGRHAKVPKT